MSKCAICKTSWTSQGMTLCPICGAKVEGEEIGTQTTRIQRPTQFHRPASIEGARQNKTNGTAVLTAPAAPAEVRKAEPTPAPVAPSQVAPPRVASPEGASSPVASPQIAPAPAAEPLVQDSVVLAAPQAAGAEKRLPAPARPLNAPLVLGLLALVAVLLLPVTLLFESHRILGILGFCASGFFVPFGPIAWMAGLGAEKRRREQGLRPESRVVVGRVLGQAGTLLLMAEVTAVLIVIAGLRLSGQLPGTFWISRHF
jgi:hypothetical protein